MKHYAVTALASCVMSIALLIIGCILVFSLSNDEDGMLILNFALFFGTLGGGMALGKFLDFLDQGDKK